MPFDSTANMLSFRLGDFGFGDFIFNVPKTVLSIQKDWTFPIHWE